MKIMSEDTAAVDVSSCASCGIAEVDELKLTECTDCDLVKYCSDACRRDHKSHHLRACKKRSAELHDELLFKQPESSHFGDCPICMLPLSIEKEKSTMLHCCSTIICNGCYHANYMREEEGRLRHTCPFCRQPASTDEEFKKQRMKRIELNNPVAMTCEGLNQYHNGDYSSAFGYYTKAAELGDAEAHYQLADLYRKGHGVEKDRGKEMYHLKEAAIGGHPSARFNLGIWNALHGNTERAVKHFIIGANLGDDDSIKTLMGMFKKGVVSKEVLAAALRAHHAAVDATKSPQREAAKTARI